MSGNTEVSHDKPKHQRGKKERLIRLPEVQSMTGLNRNLIYEIEDFPRPVKISTRCSAWVQSEVQEWIKKRISQQR